MLSESFLPLTPEIDQLFTIFYVPVANTIGYKLLIEKLNVKKETLENELRLLKKDLCTDGHMMDYWKSRMVEKNN
jgi:hypothetical protein